MDCPSEQQIDLDLWADRLNAELNRQRYPLSGIIELTDRCNLSCVHCYINQPAGSSITRERELSTSQVCHIIDEIAQAGCLFLILTGGEVLLRKDFPEIYLHTLQAGILPTIFTNGTMIDEELADMLAVYQPQTVDITLYGATRETYEAITRQPGSYDRCMHAIDLLQQKKVPVSIKSILLRLNQHELGEMQAFASTRGLRFRYDSTLWPRLDGDTSVLTYGLNCEESFAVDNADPERAAEWQRRVSEYSGIKLRDEFIFSCGAGTRSFHIDSQGNLCICTMMRNPNYSLLEMSFGEGWQKLGEMRTWRRQKTTECQTCQAGSLCMQCPGWSQVVHGDLETPVESVCQMANFRYNHL